MNLLNILRKVWYKVFPKKNIEEKISGTISVSAVMESAISLWHNMYVNAPPWKGGPENVIPLNLPSAIAEEHARLVTVEMKTEVTGSAFADYLNEQYQKAIINIDEKIEMYCAEGGIAMKPYISDGRIMVDFTSAENFLPTAYNSNKEITGAVFVDTQRIGKHIYTRLEKHEHKGNIYTVTNKAFRSEQLNTITDDDTASARYPFQHEVELSTVPGWEDLLPEVVIENVDKPLFVYVKVPRGNNVDTGSPLGASVYSRAVDIIEQTDRQFTRILFEFKAFEAAIDASSDLFKKDKFGNSELPAGKERIFRSYEEAEDGKSFLEAFAPEIRDDSMFNGLNKYFQRIEFQCGLSYGTISDPAMIEKTATEILTSRQRSYSLVSKMQKAWDKALKNLVYAMATLATLYNLAPVGAYDVTCEWGDGILEDTNVEYQRRWSMVVAGKYKLEKFYAWYFGVSEEEALEMIPEAPEPDKLLIEE